MADALTPTRPKTGEEIRAAFDLLVAHAFNRPNVRPFASIPARPDHDADLIVGAALDEREALKARVAELEGALAGTRALAIEDCAKAFEQEIAWHNDECVTAEGKHPWYACDCEVRYQAADIRALATKTGGGA